MGRAGWPGFRPRGAPRDGDAFDPLLGFGERLLLRRRVDPGFAAWPSSASSGWSRSTPGDFDIRPSEPPSTRAAITNVAAFAAVPSTGTSAATAPFRDRLPARARVGKDGRNRSLAYLGALGAEDVDRYKAAKLREGLLGPNQINKSLGLLAHILDAAADYGHLDPARNPARGSRRRLKRTTPNRPTIEPEQLPSLPEAAGRLRPILAAMAGAGLRNGEACGLDWRDVNLASGTLAVAEAKTEAGIRQVDAPAPLREELAEQKARSGALAGPAFPNRSGGRQTPAT